MKKILLLIIAGLGLYILLCSCWILKESRDASHWPQVKGEVISSSLTIHYLPKFINMSADPLRWYGVEVQYEYTVGDERFSSDRLSFYNWDTGNSKDALKVMNKYRHLHKLMVYYDPQNIKESVLVPGDVGDLYMPLMIGGLLTAWGLILLFSQSLGRSDGVDKRLLQAQASQNQGKLEEALWHYNDVIRMNPYLVSGYCSRGRLFLEEGDWDEAIADFNRALRIDPNDALIYFSLGNAYLGKEEYDKAWGNMQMAMEKGFSVKPEILENIKSKLP